MPGKPVALVYGHYDVQPPEPLDEWISPPFEPTVRDGNIYARGATDDKGQMLTHVKSVEAWIKAVGKLPLQVKFIIEGEEEVGSEHLTQFVAANRDRAGMRYGRRQRFEPVRARRAGDHVRIARNRLLRTAPARPEAGFALRHVWRRGDQSGQRIGRAACSAERRARPHPGARILRRGGAANRARTRRVPIAATNRRRVHEIARRHRSVRRSRVHFARTSLGTADVRHQRPDERLSGRRRQDGAAGHGPARSSASGSCRIKTRKRSRPRCASFSKSACRRESRWS